MGVRTAGLHTLALDPSRIPLSTELAAHVVELDGRLSAEAAHLGEALHAVIGTASARPYKAVLVGLRRAVHRGARIDGPLAALLDAAPPEDTLGAALVARLRGHVALRRTRAEAFAELERVLPDETRAAAAALGELVRDPAFARGLDYASPDLYEDVLRWVERDGPVRRPQDKAAVRLAKYASRAVAKPSPLTTFASSGLGHWATGVGASVRLESPATAETAEAGLAALSHIAAALAHVPELDGSARLRVNPSAVPVPLPEGERWLFTVPGPSGEVRSLPATPALSALLAAVEDAPSPRRLRARLGGAERGSAADAVVTRLIRLGLLEVDLDVPDQHLDAAALHEWLDRRVSVVAGGESGAAHAVAGGRPEPGGAKPQGAEVLGGGREEPDACAKSSHTAGGVRASRPAPSREDRLTRLLGDLRAIRDQVEAARTAKPGEHRAITAALHHHTAAAAQRLQLAVPNGVLGQGPVYFHHTLARGTAATLDADAWRPALADLALVPALLAPFDTLTPPREALRRHAVTAYGEGFGRPFTQFLRDFGGWWATGGPHTRTERDARRQDALHHLIATTPPASDGTVRLAPRAVRELCATWPDPDTSGDRHACYVQTWPDPTAIGRTGLVLNTATCGHGTGRTRIARLLDAAAGTAPCRSEVLAGVPESRLLEAEVRGSGSEHDVIHAEFDAAYGSALNQRVPATRYAIDLGGAASHRPPEQLLRPADLDVVHDPGNRRLRLVHRPTGRVVRPLHLGLLATPLLPLPARLLVEAFGQTSYAFWSDWPQLWRMLPSERTEIPSGPGAGHSGRAVGGPAGATWTKLPRLALGAVVLRRASWFIDAGGAPVRGAGEAEAAHMVRVHGWRAALGLPTRCFLRVLTPRPAGGFEGPALRDKDRKPVFVDFAHPHLLRVFARAAATGRPLLLTEALPDLQDAPAHQDGHRRTTEFLVELPTPSVPFAPSDRDAMPC
ncbi:lantibiotic dehydratase [Streptomyces sp. NPDC048111]|uniref:lantibiotic dehydratase n=1 Tax=Streptomyces sp. NPDC048111 TaxID=3365500 RepID=UPI0037166B23